MKILTGFPYMLFSSSLATWRTSWLARLVAPRGRVLGWSSLFLRDQGWHGWNFTLTAGLHLIYVCYRRGRMFPVPHFWYNEIVGGVLMVYRKDSISGRGGPPSGHNWRL